MEIFHFIKNFLFIESSRSKIIFWLCGAVWGIFWGDEKILMEWKIYMERKTENRFSYDRDIQHHQWSTKNNNCFNQLLLWLIAFQKLKDFKNLKFTAAVFSYFIFGFQYSSTLAIDRWLGLLKVYLLSRERICRHLTSIPIIRILNLQSENSTGLDIGRSLHFQLWSTSTNFSCNNIHQKNDDLSAHCQK